MQNPSDLEATYDGKKGPGYQAQLVETCSDKNSVQLILEVLPQTAVESDANAVQPLLETLEQKGRLPDTLLADTIYGSDENVQAAAAKEVELVSPVPGGHTTDATAAPIATPDALSPLSIDDFAVDERTGDVTACPSGRVPLSTVHDPQTGTTTVTMPVGCATCPFQPVCPVQRKSDGSYQLRYTDKQRRAEERRREEQTDAFRQRYAKRAGIESTNSGLKRRLGLGQLRVRGQKAVFHALYLKVAGWNLLRAAASGKLVKMVRQAIGRLWCVLRFCELMTTTTARRSTWNPFLHWRRHHSLSPPSQFKISHAEFCR